MVEIKNLTVQLKDFRIKNINLKVNKGDFFIILGPTGSGKTLLLESIAGLVKIKDGNIFVNNRDVTRLSPEKRGIAIVYQDYSLFPNMKVIDNIKYGLKFTLKNKASGSSILSKYIKILNLEHLLNRYPDTLSGGEMQRVAIARALVIQPEILLLDEPISSVDPRFREEIKRHLKIIMKLTNTTMMMVTHDFADAITLGSRGAVMHNGEIVQEGPINEIFNNPRTKFVADFTGIKNLFPALFNGSTAYLNSLKIEIGSTPKNNRGYIAIRPENIVISETEIKSSMRNTFKGKIINIEHTGYLYEIDVAVKETTFKSLVTGSSLIELQLHEGKDVFIHFKASSIHIIE